MFEIERKFLIVRPENSSLSEYKFSDIEQTYLIPKGRVRMRKYEDKTVYTHTVKTSVTNITRIEEEREITQDEYNQLLNTADPERSPISKRRYIIPYNGLDFELDDFGEEYTYALLEIELPAEDSKFYIPDFIKVVREVTDEKEYKNSVIAAKGFPDK